MKELELKVPIVKDHQNLLSHFWDLIGNRENASGIPIRFVVTQTDKENYHCEIGMLPMVESQDKSEQDSIFYFKKRDFENTDKFNAVFLTPTGIGSDIGGHAGDATPAARMIASICDTLITHPNVVNASDVNEMSENMLYVEGSVISRLLMGSVGLQPVKANRILTVIDDHPLEIYSNAAINTVNAARATYGLNCDQIVKLNPPIQMTAEYTSAGRAGGTISGLEHLFEVLDEFEGKYDALAISSVIKVPMSYHMDYFQSEGGMINPWGGIEAMLTHAISMKYNIPSAHAPMFESEDIANMDPGVVDPRMAAEAISVSFLQCLLKGLQRSPKILTDSKMFNNSGVVSAKDVSCLIIPVGCLGLPTLAALEQGIPVIAVKESANMMQNSLSELPWKSNQYFEVENYLEATGIVAALRSGISVPSVRRPLSYSQVHKIKIGVAKEI